MPYVNYARMQDFFDTGRYGSDKKPHSDIIYALIISKVITLKYENCRAKKKDEIKSNTQPEVSQDLSL